MATKKNTTKKSVAKKGAVKKVPVKKVVAKKAAAKKSHVKKTATKKAAAANEFVIVRNVLTKYCGGGGDVVITDGVTSIEDSAFEGCTNLTSVTIPSGVASIGNRAFKDCECLTNLSIPDSVTSVGEAAFNGCKGLADADGFVILRGILFSYFGKGGDVVVPDGVTSIGMWAFDECKKLTNLTIPNGVTSIGDWAFSGCGLTSVAIPDSVTSIGEYAFWRCESLTNVTIPDSVKAIGDYAFQGCGSLASVTLPKCLDGKLPENVFEGCPLAKKTPADEQTEYGIQYQINGYYSGSLLTGTGTVKAKTIVEAIELAKKDWTEPGALTDFEVRSVELSDDEGDDSSCWSVYYDVKGKRGRYEGFGTVCAETEEEAISIQRKDFIERGGLEVDDEFEIFPL